MQPLVGVIADRSTSKWGRRRPFMVAGSLVVGMCLFVLGWTKEIVSLFVSDPQLVCFGRGERRDGRAMAHELTREQKKTMTITIAVLSIYAVDFAINVGMHRHFAFDVDCLTDLT